MPVGLASALGVVRLGGLSELGLAGLVSELVVSELVVDGLVVRLGNGGGGGGNRLVAVELVGLRIVLLVVVDEVGLNEDIPSDELPSDEVGAGANNGELAGLVVCIIGVGRGVLSEDVLERLLPPTLVLEFPV